MQHGASVRVLATLGYLATVAGVIDPIEGSLVILPGIGAVALAGHLAVSPHRRLLFMAFGLAAVGVVAMLALSAAGGFGGSTGRSIWWAAALVPYPVGWVLAVVGGWRLLNEIFSRGTSGAAHAAANQGNPRRS